MLSFLRNCRQFSEVFVTGNKVFAFPPRVGWCSRSWSRGQGGPVWLENERVEGTVGASWEVRRW